MITHQELKELASFLNEDAFFVSLYLNVDPTENPNGQWLKHFKNMAKDQIKRFDQSDKKLVKQDFEKIENYLTDRPDGLKRGLAIISCAEKDFWREYHLALPLNNLLVIERDPYIKPLATIIDLYQAYIVVVVGQEKARALISRTGEIEELTNFVGEMDEPNRGKDGRYTYMALIRAEKTKEKIERIIHKDAVNFVEKLIKTERIKRILVGGTDSARGRFKDLLPAKLKRNVVGEFTIDRHANDKEILEKILPIMQQIEYDFERKALDELFNSNGNVVLGLSDVLTALQQGNIHKMYVMSNVTQPGMLCRSCGAVTPVREDNCPYCGNEMLKVPYMLDHAIQKALDQGARVDMLDHAPRLEKSGGVGALLRY